MTTITIEGAQSQLTELIHRLSPGEEVIITENDQPVARLMVAVPPTKKPRPSGTLKTAMWKPGEKTTRVPSTGQPVVGF